MILFYSEQCDGKVATLQGSEAIHCRQALRKNVGDQIHVTDGLGQCFSGEITHIAKKSIEVNLQDKVELSKPRDYRIHIGIAPTKNISRFEWFLEKATEFGIDEITPLLCARSERKIIKEERLHKIMVSAMKQSLKSKLPKLNQLIKFVDFVGRIHNDQKFIAHLEEQPGLLINEYSPKHNALVLIGPEGDFSPEEILLAKKSDFRSVSLGDYRLRTETAGISAVQQLHFVNLANESPR